jgi:hypothetical protein
MFYILETDDALDMLGNFVALQVISTFPSLLNTGVVSNLGLLTTDEDLSNKIC